MAEFTKVCQQALRMLKAEAGTDHIALCISENGGIEIVSGKFAGCKTATADALEKHIMKWAAEHPEPVYPTWNEAWKQLFPMSARLYAPCPAYFLEQSLCDNVATSEKCGKCKSTPIPADIAAKLGVKPIENKGGTGK